MQVFQALCYALSAACFLLAVFRHKFGATTLDFVALGLFVGVLPIAVLQVSQIL